MILNFLLFEVDLSARRRKMFRPRPTAWEVCKALSRQAWIDALARSDLAPENFEAAGNAGLALRLAIAGSARALIESGSNPLSGLIPSRSGHADWRALATRLASAKGLDPLDPFHQARAALARGDKALGKPLAPIDENGCFYGDTDRLMKRLRPEDLSLAVDEVAREAERHILADHAPAARSGPGAARL